MMRSVGVVLAVWLAGLGAAAQFGKISVAHGLISELYAGAGPVALGLMVSVVGLVGLVFGTTAGVILSRVGVRRALVGALALGAVASAVQAMLPGYAAMMALRVAEGVSHLAIVVAGPVAMAAASGGRFQGLAMTLWSSFFGVSYAVLALIAPPVLAAGGIAALFLGHGVWMGACALICAVLLPGDAGAPVGPRPGLWREHLAIYRSAHVAAPALGFVFYTCAYVAILTLMPPLFPPGMRAGVAAGMPILSIVVSLTLGVWLLDRVGPVRVVQGGFVMAAAGAVIWALPLGWGGAGLAAALLAGGLGLAQGASFAAIPVLNPDPADRARAAGAIAQLGNLGTVTGTPLLAAMLAAQGPGAIVAFALPLCLCGIAMHVWLAARRSAI
jgi:MFS transporter, DHA1 family, inner membrane transport protein